MVTPIKHFKRDPNGLGRGEGIYYHRGHGYYSQYSRKRDEARHSKGWKTNAIGVPKATRFPQIGDGIISKYWSDHPQWFKHKKVKK